MRTGNKNKLLVVQVAALGYDFLCKNHGNELNGLMFQPMESIFPALTCPVQATFKTGVLPKQHGMFFNGFFDRTLHRPFFWEQSSSLVEGERIWKKFRENGKKVGIFFWQQSLGEDVDFLLSPAPIHKHHGGMIQDCYSQPPALYQDLCENLGRPFNLMNYWGPLASYKSSAWITEATCHAMSAENISPDLLLTYLPVLDYDLQRYGAKHAKSKKALGKLLDQLNMLIRVANDTGYEVIIYGDYAIEECGKDVIFPNKLLKEQGYLITRTVKGMLYPDYYLSKAIAVVDHEIANVYLKNESDAPAVKEIFKDICSVSVVLGPDEKKHSGDLVLRAKEGEWFAYPWWDVKAQAPEYAGHVDIHNKPGYDPCELFFGWPPGSVGADPLRIKGSHGKDGTNRKVCWVSTWLDCKMSNLTDLSEAVRSWLERNS